MDFKFLHKKLFLLGSFLFVTTLLFAQNTVVSGVVTDGKTKQTMPFVTVALYRNYHWRKYR